MTLCFTVKQTARTGRGDRADWSTAQRVPAQAQWRGSSLSAHIRPHGGCCQPEFSAETGSVFFCETPNFRFSQPIKMFKTNTIQIIKNDRIPIPWECTLFSKIEASVASCLPLSSNYILILLSTSFSSLLRSQGGILYQNVLRISFPWLITCLTWKLLNKVNFFLKGGYCFISLSFRIQNSEVIWFLCPL